MKVVFTMDGVNYIGPSKKEANKFVRFWNRWEQPKRLQTTWKIKHIERAPSYGQMQRLDLSNIEYK